MKHAIWLVTILFFQSIAIAQNTSVNSSSLINENFQNVELKQVLTLLKTKYGIKSAYGEKIIRNKTVNAELINYPTEQVFARILSGTSLDYEMVENDLVIIRKQKQYNEKSSLSDLTGSVKDALSGESLPYAYVWLDKEKSSLVTNVDGYFLLTNVRLPATLKISYLGYKDTTFTISGSYSHKRINVDLVPTPQKLEEVVVTDQKTNDFELNEIDGIVKINPAIASSVPSTGEVDIFRTLQLLPGINATNEISSGLSIRGGTANQNLVMYDGFTVYHVDHLFGYFSAFNPYAIKSVRLFKGGYGAEYGGRVSSIVDISGKDGNMHKTSGSLNLNLLSINTTLEVPLSKNNTTLFFSGRRSYTDLVSTPLFVDIFSNFSSNITSNTNTVGTNNLNSGGHHMGNGTVTPRDQSIATERTLEPEFYYSDFNLKISSNFLAKNRISLSMYNSRDLLNFSQNILNTIDDTLSIQSSSQGKINWGNTGASLKLSRLWDSEHFSNFLVSFSNYNSTYSDITNSTSTGQNAIITTSASTNQENGILDISFKLDHEWQTSTSGLFKIGISSSVYSTDFISTADGETVVIEQQNNQTLTNAYLVHKFNLLKKLELNAGLRGSYFSPTDKFYLVPRLSANFILNEEINLRAAYGQYNQFLNQTNTKNALLGSRDFWLLADDVKVPVQQATNYVVGIGYQTNDNLIVGVDFYSSEFDGLLEYAFGEGGLVTEFQNFQQLFFEGTGEAKGMEVLLKKNSTRFQGWVSYTLSQVKYRFDDINDGNSFYADHDRRNELSAYGAYKTGNFEFFATWLYGSGSPYSLASSASFASQNHDDFESHVSVIAIDEKNVLRLSPYHRLDIGGTYFFKINHVRAQTTLSVFNVYNRKNIQDKRLNQIVRGLQSGMGMQNPILQATDVTLLGIAPSLSFRISF